MLGSVCQTKLANREEVAMTIELDDVAEVGWKLVGLVFVFRFLSVCVSVW